MFSRTKNCNFYIYLIVKLLDKFDTVDKSDICTVYWTYPNFNWAYIRVSGYCKKK